MTLIFRIVHHNADLMDQQFRPLPSSSNTNCSVQAESLEGAAVNEVNELQKGALLANNDYDEEDCGCMLRTLGQFVSG